MAKKTLKLRPWTNEDIRTLKTLAREKAKTTVIARKLKRTVGATLYLGHTLLEKCGPIEGDSSTVGLVANLRQHQERRWDGEA
jgi:hypothetical protein